MLNKAIIKRLVSPYYSIGEDLIKYTMLGLTTGIKNKSIGDKIELRNCKSDSTDYHFTIVYSLSLINFIR